MDRQKILRLLPRLVLAWGFATLVVICYGSALIVFAGPALQLSVEFLMPGFITSISANPEHSGTGDVVMVFHAVRPVPIAGDHVVAPWIQMQESINAGHDLVPAVIMFTVLAAWPYERFGEGLRALTLGTMACAAILVWTTSVHFAGLLEINLQRVASHFHEIRATPFYLTQLIFFESGGQWLLSLLASASIAMLATRTKPGAAFALRSAPIQL